MDKRPTLAAGRPSQSRTGKDLLTSVPTATHIPRHRCKICPLCRCHFDCRPEPVEAAEAVNSR